MGRRALAINLCFEASQGWAKCVATEQEQLLGVDVGTSPRHCQPRRDTQQTWTSQKKHLGSGGGQLVQNQAISKQNWPRNDFFLILLQEEPPVLLSPVQKSPNIKLPPTPTALS